MKECFVITAYCNSIDKVEVLKQTLDNLKKFNNDIIIHAHYPIPNEIQKNVNFYYYSSDNPVLNRYNLFWYELNDYRLEYKEYDIAYTVMKLWKEIILFHPQYDILHILNYDVNVTEDLYNLSLSYIQLMNKSVFYENYSIPNNVQIQFFSLLKKDLDNFISILDKEQLLTFPSQKFLPSLEEYLSSKLDDNYYIIPYRNCESYMDEFLKNEVNHVIFSGVKRKPTYVKAENGYYEPDIDKFLFVNKDFYSIFFGYLDEILYCLIFEIKRNVKLKKNGIEYNVSGYHFLISMDINDKIEIDDELIDKNFIQSFLKLECKIYKK